jgi:hypothetical protein
MLFLFREKIFFKTSVKNIFYAPIRITFKAEGFPASLFQSVRSMLFYKIEDAHTCFECLLRMFPALNNYRDHLCNIISYRSRPPDKTLRAPCSVISMVRRHMGMQRCISVRGTISLMLCYSYVVIIDCYHSVIIDDPYTPSLELPWYTVTNNVYPPAAQHGS